MAYQTVTVKPKDGGHLISRGSSSEVGLANYTIKRDFRRNLDRERRREGYDHFWGNQSKAQGRQPFPNYPNFGEPIVLVTLARRPNGKVNIIVGTETMLWRFFSMDDATYVLGDENGIYVDGDVNGPYFEENPGDWQLIGSGFKTWAEGAHRWEAVSINGSIVFNNGADLPQEFRLEWNWVRPLYELREQGIARVGTIADYKNILMLADITEIDEDKLADNFALADSGAITAAQAGSEYSGLTTVTQNAGSYTAAIAGGAFVFDAGMIGKTIRYTNAFRATILAVPDPTHATLDKTPQNNSTGLPFWVIDSNDYLITSSAPYFTAAMVGKSLLWDTGEVRKILQFVDSQTVRTNMDYAVPSGPFALENTTAYDYYSGGGVQRRHWRTMWSLPFYPRRFGASTPCQIAKDSNIVYLDYPVKSFAAGQEVSIVDRNFEVSYISRTGGVATVVTKLDHGYANGNSVKVSGADQAEYNGIFPIFNVTARSFQFNVAGDPISPATSSIGKIIVGAGVMTGTIQYISGLGSIITLDAPAQEPFNNAEIVQSDVDGSILGYEDLQEDGSGILRMLELQGVLVYYKDTSIVLATYSANPDAPFVFQSRKVPSDSTLHYRWTLISVQGQWHLFAGRNGFYRFDLTVQNPQELKVFDWMSNIFFDVAEIGATNSIFAADNAITKEIFIMFDVGDDYEYALDKGLTFDYKHGTIATTGIQITAACTVKRPESGLSVGETEDWFVMGGPSGEVLIYGKVDRPLPQFSQQKEIFYRRSGSDTETRNGYDSVLESGLSDFGDGYNEKDVAAYVLHLASQSTGATSILFELFGALNAADGVQLLTNHTLDIPKKENLIPVFYRQNAFQARLTVTGIDNPTEIAGCVWSVDGVKSASITRRPTT